MSSPIWYRRSAGWSASVSRRGLFGRPTPLSGQHPRPSLRAGLGDGSLPVELLKSYVAQDAHFLEAFARAYAFCLATARRVTDLYGFRRELIAGVRR